MRFSFFISIGRYLYSLISTSGIFSADFTVMAETQQTQMARMATSSGPTAGRVIPDFPSFAAELPPWTREKYQWLYEAALRYDGKTKKWRESVNFTSQTN